MLLPQVDPSALSDEEKKMASQRLREILACHGGRFAEMSAADSDAIISLLVEASLDSCRLE